MSRPNPRNIYIYEKMKEVVEEIGSENVVQVITDNASNVRGAGLMIQEKYKNIYWTPCIMHCLNLVLKVITHKYRGSQQFSRVEYSTQIY